MMATDKLGLYVHIPYCKRKCNYCDFCSFPTGNDGVPNAYVDRLVDEILAYKSSTRRILSTVYFGGGTPSLLSSEQMERIMNVISESFIVTPDAELTFEANPGTLSAEKANSYRKLGFNRVSLGLQSIHKIEMEKLGRIHNYESFLQSYRALRSAGFNNINVDLMYGIPYQNMDSFEKTLRCVAALSPEHISCYGLIVECGTPFYDEQDSLPLPDQDIECDMYYAASKILKEYGYSHYEISNYSRPGFESQHNLLYWNFDEYIGVGASAHSYYQGQRSSNTCNMDSYISASGIKHEEEITPDSEDKRYEFAMLKLRLKDGFSLSEYEERFGTSFLKDKEEVIEKFVDLGLLDVSNGMIRLTEEGFYVSNTILVEIL